MISLIKNILGRQKGRVSLLFLVSLAVAASESLGLSMIVPMLDYAIKGRPIGGLSRIFAKFLPQLPGPGTVATIMALTVFLFCLRAALKIVQTYVKNLFVWNTAAAWSANLMRGYLMEERLFFLNDRRGAMFHNILEETGVASSCLLKIMEFAIRVVLSIFLLGALFFAQFQIAFLVFLYCLLSYLILARMMRNSALMQGKNKVALFQDLSAGVSEILNNHETIRAFGAETHFMERFNLLNDRLRSLQIKMNTVRGLPGPLLEAGLFLLFFVVFCGAVFFFGMGIGGIVPVLGMFLLVSRQLLDNFSSIISERINIFQLIPSLRLVEELSADFTRRSSGRATGIAFPGIRRGIFLDDVSFAYGDRQVFDHLHLQFPARKTVLVTGPSGSGKSTLSALLLDFLQPQSGRILIDELPLSSIDREDFRRHCGYVGQSVQLFHGTLRENILLGDPQADQARLEEALALSGLADTVRALPRGLDTQVGESGELLSGGQRQRVAIARALLRPSDLIIFDEPTSALDPVAARAIHECLVRLRGKKTLIVFNHDPDLVRDPDLFYRMDDLP